MIVCHGTSHLKLFFLWQSSRRLPRSCLTNETHDTNQRLVSVQYRCNLTNTITVLWEYHHTGVNWLDLICALIASCSRCTWCVTGELLEMFHYNFFELEKFRVAFEGRIKGLFVHGAPSWRSELRKQSRRFCCFIWGAFDALSEFFHDFHELTVASNLCLSTRHAFAAIHDRLDKVIEGQDTVLV